MLKHSRRRALGPWRRWTFRIWIALTIIAAGYLAVVPPFAQYFGADMQLIGIIVPPLMILLLGIGLAWLVWLVTSSPRSDRNERARRAAPPSHGRETQVPRR